MSAELDHFFVCTSLGAAAAGQRLIDFGLREGTPNTHPGQGTACRRYFFHNAFLELVWVENAAEAQNDLTRRTGLWERWSRRDSGASPLGVGFRPRPGQGEEIPFATWDYRPTYLPESLAIQMANNSQVFTEPLLFYLAFGRRADSDQSPRRQPLDHACGLKEITRLCVTVARGAPFSTELAAAQVACRGLSFVAGSEPLAEIGFDGEQQGRTADFRPELPIIFRW